MAWIGRWVGKLGGVHSICFSNFGRSGVSMSSSQLADVPQRKKDLRKIVRAALRSLTSDQKRQESSAICRHIVRSSFFEECRNVGVYIHCDKLNEVDTTEIVEAALKAGKQCFVPKVGDQPRLMDLLHIDSLADLEAVPPYNILEPSDTYANGTHRKNALDVDGGLDLLLMPGLAFDRDLGRLGRGGGYYDTFVSKCLAKCAETGAKAPLLVALAYQCQVVDSVPMTTDDRHVDLLVTQEGITQQPDTS